MICLRGGSADASIREKHIKCEEMALSLKLPLIRIVEGSGGGGSVKLSKQLVEQMYLK